jgi:hypothetical protein
VPCSGEVYRTDDGEKVCSIDMAGLKFIYPQDNCQGKASYQHFPSCIVVEKSGHIYNACLKTLIHLNAKGVHLIEGELRDGYYEGAEVLGLPVPGLYRYNLEKFEEMGRKAKLAELRKKTLDCTVVDWNATVTNMFN